MAKMWFGNEWRWQWVPEPASGMQASHVGYGEELQYQNGRKGVVRSMQTHKEYQMDFPVQEASGLEGLDVFSKFASGFYADLDTYPVYFADRMNYDQNLMPEGWASPGLYRRGWAAIVEDSPRNFTNHASNPSVESSAVGFATIAGTGGGASGSRVTTTAYVGTASYEVQWTVATSAVSGGVLYDAFSGITVAAGSSYGGMVHVSTSKIQRVQAFIRFLNGSSTVIGSAPSDQFVLAANTWTEIRIPAGVAPAGTVSARIEVIAVAGASASNWAVGDRLRLDGIMFYSTNTVSEPPSYFDLTFPNTRMSGSAIQWLMPRNIPTITGTVANSYNMPINTAVWNVLSSPNAYPTPTYTFGNIPYALIPIPEGYTLHVGYSGSTTGTAQLVVEGYNTGVISTGVNVLTPLPVTGAQRMNFSISSTTADYVKIYVRRTSNVASTITLNSIMAQLWPTGVSPNLNGNHIEGKGHRGLKFTDTPTVESYVLFDPYQTQTVHYKGMSTTLIEAQDRG